MYKKFKEWKKWRESLMPTQPVKKVRYSGIVLDEASYSKLVNALQKYLKPLLEAGWQMQNRPPPPNPPERLPHHMTITPSALPEDLRPLIGKPQTMVAFKWGQSDKAAAVAVKSSVRSTNAVPHITVAISSTGKPFDSNQIKDWIDLPQEITLTGTVEEVM